MPWAGRVRVALPGRQAGGGDGRAVRDAAAALDAGHRARDQRQRARQPEGACAEVRRAGALALPQWCNSTCARMRVRLEGIGSTGRDQEHSASMPVCAGRRVGFGAWTSSQGALALSILHVGLLLRRTCHAWCGCMLKVQAHALYALRPPPALKHCPAVTALTACGHATRSPP